MPAKTNFWTCCECGFHNAPHAFRKGDEVNKRCEQCGASRDLPGAFDRKDGA